MSLTSVRPTPAPRCGVSLRPGVTVRDCPEALEIAVGEVPVLRIRGLDAAVRDHLAGLRLAPDAGERRAALTDRARAQLDSLDEALRRCVLAAVWEGSRPVVLAENLRGATRVDPRPLDAQAVVRLGKFAYLRRKDGEMVLECADAGTRVLLADRAAVGMLPALGAGVQVAALAAGTELAPQTTLAALELMAGAGAVEVADPSGAFPSDTDPALRQWDFHDLVFHSRSRFGRTDEPFGGIFPYKGQIEPLPAARPRRDGPVVELPLPDFDEVLSRDPGLMTTMETRRSTRAYGVRPLTLAQLSEFLYRVARIRGTYGPMPGDGMPYEATSRPYPTGGAAYELEIYLTVTRCDGLDAGCYHYEADTHRLRRIDAPAPSRDMLLAQAATSAGGGVTPDVLLTLTSRFQRIQWKYRAIAYAVTLKHVGVLYQTMYLVATAMGLGACGLGSGSSDEATRAFGLDYLTESSVGEFLLGSLPERPLPARNDASAAKLGAAGSWRDGVGADWFVRAAQARWGQP